MRKGSPNNKLIYIIVALFIIILGYFGLRDNDNQKGDTPNKEPGEEHRSNEADFNQPNNSSQSTITPAHNGQFKTGTEQLPRSLQGTDVDGDIIIDGNQQLVVTRGLRRLFDYFLSALGEEEASTIDARIEAYISSRTPDPAASSAIALYYKYKNYLTQLSTIEDKYGNLQMQATEAGILDLNAIRQRQYDIKNIRKEIFDAETINAFFETDDQLYEYNVAMIEIANNDSMTDAQKEMARSDYISRLPDSLLKDRAMQKQSLDTLLERTERLKNSGASESELFAMRAELVGIPAAERLAKVDKQNADFDQRFETYQQKKASIMTTNADQATKNTQIKELEQQLFDENEQKRLAGYAAFKSKQSQ